MLMDNQKNIYHFLQMPLTWEKHHKNSCSSFKQ